MAPLTTLSDMLAAHGFRERYLEQFHSAHWAWSVPGAIADNAAWMIWNTVLAIVPLVLVWLVVVRGVERRWVRWGAIAAFVAFLPNAAYVLTDIFDFRAEARALGWSAAVWLVLLPTYLGFIFVAMLSYAASLRIAARGLRRSLTPRRTGALILVAHVMSACGIYLGRVLRLNSWDFLAAPGSVAGGLAYLAGTPEAVAYVATIAVATGLVAAALWPAAGYVERQAHVLRRSGAKARGRSAV